MNHEIYIAAMRVLIVLHTGMCYLPMAQGCTEHTTIPYHTTLTLLISEQNTLFPASGSVKNLLLNIARDPVNSMRAFVLACVGISFQQRDGGTGDMLANVYLHSILLTPCTQGSV